MSKRVTAFASESRFKLVETLAERVAEILISEFDLPWCRVRINKRGAVRGAGDVGVVIERRRTMPGPFERWIRALTGRRDCRAPKPSTRIGR